MVCKVDVAIQIKVARVVVLWCGIVAVKQTVGVLIDSDALSRSGRDGSEEQRIAGLERSNDRTLRFNCANIGQEFALSIVDTRQPYGRTGTRTF